MPNPCVGIMGRIFGHKFRSVIIRYDAVDPARIKHLKAAAISVSSILNKLSSKSYSVRCSRCGIEAS